MATKPASKRLSKEFIAMRNDPPPFIWAVPDEKNILTWNFLIRGPPDTPYAGGEYHGILLFPSDYPFKPPGIKMLTPSGRFQPNKKICFSMSDFHPASWNPAWSVATILTGLLSFMLTDEMTTGSVTSTDAHKRSFATRSHAWNLQQAKYREMFPEYATLELRDLPNMGENARRPPASLEETNTISFATPSTSTVSSNIAPSSAPHPPSATVAAANNAVARLPGLGPSDDKTAGWMAAWKTIIWERWRWGLLIVFAVLISRFSSTN